MLILEADIIAGRVGEESHLLLGQRPHLFGRAAHIEVAALQCFARRYQAAGAQHHVVFNHGAIHHHGTHADENTVADAATVQHGLMAHGDIVADQQWKAVWVEGACVSDMQHRAVLNTAARADADTVHVATYHHQRPDGTVVADIDVTQHHGAWVDKDLLAQLWRFTLIAANLHTACLSNDC